jgi:hypothetical protein
MYNIVKIAIAQRAEPPGMSEQIPIRRQSSVQAYTLARKTFRLPAVLVKKIPAKFDTI